MNSIDKLKMAKGLSYNWHFKSIGNPNPVLVDFAIELKDFARARGYRLRANSCGQIEIYQDPEKGGLAVTLFI